MLAAGSGNEEIVALLLEKGADRNARDNEGKTAVDYALAGEYNTIVELLQKEPEETPAPDAVQPGEEPNEV
jgi:ankyrin repeat protein